MFVSSAKLSFGTVVLLSGRFFGKKKNLLTTNAFYKGCCDVSKKYCEKACELKNKVSCDKRSVRFKKEEEFSTNLGRGESLEV